MVKLSSSEAESGSGSDSESSKGSRSPSQSPRRSRSGTPQVAPTPGYSLEHHDSRSNSPVHRSNQSSPHNRSRSNTPGTYKSNKSRSHSRSRSRSHSVASHKSGSHSPGDKNNQSQPESRSQSPNLQIDDHASDRSRSQVGSHKSRSRSRSVSRRSRSGSGSARSGSRSRSRSAGSAKSGSRSRSHSGTPPNRSRSGSRSPSQPGSRKSRTPRKSSRSRSRSGSHKSRSATPRSRSHSGSSKSNASEAAVVDKRKRPAISSDTDASDVEKKQVKKKSALIDSDSEEEPAKVEEKEDVNAEALFGDADDISTDEEEKTRRNEKNDRRDSDSDHRRRDSDRRSSDDERDHNNRTPDHFADPEPEPEPIPETRIDVEIPRIVSDLGKDIHFVKLPNFLSVETRPFDVDTYEDEIDEEETLDEEGKQRIKLKVSNTIRWRDRFDDGGNVVKESNARIIKWSDGSMSLHLGSEIFDVYKQPLQGDHNHLFIRQGTGLQGQAVFRTKLTFRPHSTESFTHKKMTMSLADRSQKTSGIKILSQVGHDPDADRQYNLKKEEEKLRAAMRQKHQARPKRGHNTSATHNTSYRDHDEGSEDEGGISINAIKNKYKKGGAPNASSGKQGQSIYSSDEEGSDFETRRSKKTDKSKPLKALHDSDDDSSGGGEHTPVTHDEKDDDEESDE